MQIWLHKIRSPEKLVLAWEPPLSVANRSRWAVGEIAIRSEEDFVFRYFDRDEISGKNNGRSVDDLSAAGFLGYPAFKLRFGAIYDGPDVCRAFSRRLPSRKRSDFREFTDSYRISQSADKGVPSLLSLTGGRQPNDGFSLVDPLLNVIAEYDLLLEVTGCRYYKEHIQQCSIGDAIQFVFEPNNQIDESAIAILCHSKIVGYVNRLQTLGFGEVIRSFDYQAEIAKINGTEERPRLFVAVKLKAFEAKAA